jgi:GNAT superfamily N-acetyltransferase
MVGRVGVWGVRGDVSQRVALRDGSVIGIGRLRRGDQAAVLAWFNALGPGTRYARFLAHVNHLDARTLHDLADIDHRDHEAFAAFSESGATVGIGRYIRIPDSEEAELAVAVADAWRGRGIATLLLTRVGSAARAAGVRRARAFCLAGNEQTIRLVSRLGPTVVSSPDGGVVEVSVDLMPARAGRDEVVSLTEPRAGAPAP